MENQTLLSLDDIYFKDAFTKTEEGINEEINQLTVGCITSKNNTFRLDKDGNLTVKTIVAEKGIPTPEIDYTKVFDMVYPIGSIYLGVNNVNPSTLFGGTWVSFGVGRTLVGVDTSQTEFNAVEKTGGNKYLQLHSHTFSGTTSSSGSHSHTGNTLEVAMKTTAYTRDCARNINSSADVYGVTITNTAGEHTHTYSGTTSDTGNGNSGNLQPYITCYMWKRTT